MTVLRKPKVERRSKAAGVAQPIDGFRGSLEWVRVSTLNLDPSYQRPLEPNKVAKIAAEFDPEAFGVIIVSRRDKGELVIVDGGHRAGAMYEMGYQDQLVQALVYDGMSKQDEARAWVKMNARRTKPKATHLFRGAVQANDPESVSVNKVLRKHGLTVSNTVMENGIRSIGTCMRLHKLGGPELLDNVITVMREAFDDTTSNLFYHDLMLAIGGIFYHYPQVDSKRLVRALKMAGDVPTIVNAARSVAGASETKTNTEMANKIIRKYDKGLRTKRLGLLDPYKNLFVGRQAPPTVNK